jgi:integrase
MEFPEHLSQINHNFKLAGLGLQIEVRGQNLYLRGVLPPKPQGKRFQAHQQRLNLREYADLIGLKRAEQQAKIICAQLIQETFQWQHYTEPNINVVTDNSLLAAIARFEQYFWTTRGNKASAQTTWKTAYAPYLGKLQAIVKTNAILSDSELIYQTILSTTPDTRSRQICCTALKSFTEFLGLALPFELQNLSGKYSYKSLKSRDLPDDETILKSYNLIPNPQWRFVFGVMATFGLRNHEVFFSDYSTLIHQARNQKATITVQESTKTGTHEVWGFRPEWIDLFNLREVNLPPLNIDLTKTSLQKIGQQVTRQFHRYHIPFSPYNLRHAWAVRTIHFGLPDAIAAQMMGHSIAIHTQTYHRWISRRDQQQAVDAAFSSKLS